MENNKYSPMTEAEFISIKEMIDSGDLSKNQIGRVTGRGGGTVWIISKATDFEDYKRIRGQYNGANSRNQDQAKVETVEASQPDSQPTGRKDKGGWKQLTPETYQRIHDLAKLDVPKTQIVKLVNKSITSVNQVLKSTSWEDYEEVKKQFQIDMRTRMSAPTPKEFDWSDSAPSPRPPTTVSETQDLVDQCREQFAQIDATFRKLGY